MTPRLLAEAGSSDANPQAPRLLEQLRARIRTKHYPIRTEDAYVDWARRFIRHFDKRHPRDLGAPEIEQFLTDLAVEGRVSASTQNQAKSALLFLYRDVIGIELEWLRNVTQARVPQRLPVVLTVTEVQRIFRQLRGAHLLMAQLLYGSGIRLMECVRLRVKDVDFERGEIIVRDGKGQKDRVTMLPRACVAELQRHLRHVRRLHFDDLRLGFGAVYLPLRWRSTTAVRQESGVGNMCSLRSSCRSTLARTSGRGITSTSRDCSGRSSRPSATPAS
jgi:integrase